MNRTRTLARACTGKLRHQQRAAALAHIARLVRHGAAPGAYGPYPCPAGCGGWHVGHRRRTRTHTPR